MTRPQASTIRARAHSVITPSVMAQNITAFTGPPPLSASLEYGLDLPATKTTTKTTSQTGIARGIQDVPLERMKSSAMPESM